MTAAAPPVINLPLADLCPSPTNPRRTFAEGPLAELAETIRRHGVLQPILVRPWRAGYTPTPGTAPKYEIVAGERRYRASLLAAQTHIMATVRDLSDTDVLEIQTIENLQREDVHPLEEAEGYQVLLLRTAYTPETLAEKLSKSKAYIYARLKLCAITGKARQAFVDGTLSASVALLIARIPVPALQQQAAREVLSGSYGEPMSARAAAEHIQRKFTLRLAEAPFPRGDAKLLEGVPKCHDCPKRTGNAPELYPDVKSADVCTDPECYGAKRAAHTERQIAAAEAAGQKVYTGDQARKVAPYGWSEYSQYIGGGLAYLDSIALGVAADSKGKHPTWRKLLGANCPAATAVIEDPSRGTLHEAAPVAALRAAAEAAGITVAKTQGRNTTEDGDQEWERIAKEQTKLRRTLLEMVIESAGDQELTDRELAAAALALYQRLDFDTQKLAYRIWTDHDGKVGREQTDELAEQINHMALADVERLLRLLTHVGKINVASYHSRPTEIPPALVEACVEWNIQVDTVRERLSGKPPAKPKDAGYRHPDTGLTWSGRGKQPAWVRTWLASGKSLADLLPAKAGA